MKIKFVFKILPVLVFYSDFLLKTWMGARSFGFFMIIRPTARSSDAIMAHELEHSRQYYLCTTTGVILLAIFGFIFSHEPLLYGLVIFGFIFSHEPLLYGLVIGFFPLLYLTIPRFRYDMEVAAYKEQLRRYEPAQREAMKNHFANIIATKYKLPAKYTKERAYGDL